MNITRLIGIAVLLCCLVFLFGDWFLGNSSKPDIIEFWKAGRVNCLTLHSSSELAELAELVKDPELVKRVREIDVVYDARGYSEPLAKCMKLERACLSFTSSTGGFLKALPTGVKSLVLDGTDFCHSPTEGIAWNADLTDAINDQFQSIVNCSSLEELFVGPWDERFTATACERLPRLESLKKLRIEWAKPASIKRLEAALPNCRVFLVTEH